jgi:hypothetical protein
MVPTASDTGRGNRLRPDRPFSNDLLLNMTHRPSGIAGVSGPAPTISPMRM